MIDRRQLIAQELVQNGKLSVKELSERLGVSTETIRKDIAYLAELGIARKTYGGAIYINEAQEIPFYRTSTLNREAKASIANAAVELVKGSMVILDAGSTTLAIAKLLSLREGLTIVTNSVSAVPILANAPGVRLLLTGGEVRFVSQDQLGFWATRALSEVSADVAFVGANSLVHPEGPSTSNLQEVAVKQAIMHAAREVYLVADSSKLALTSPYRFAAWRDFTGLITDENMPASFVERVGTQTRVITVKVATAAPVSDPVAGRD